MLSKVEYFAILICKQKRHCVHWSISQVTATNFQAIDPLSCSR